MEISFVIGCKDGRCYHLKKDVPQIIGLKIGDKINGELLDLPGYEFEITGGSDFAGFPMKKGITSARKRILVSGKTTGIKRKLKKGEKRRITVAGEIIHEKTAQVNLKVIKEGSKKLDELLGNKQ